MIIFEHQGEPFAGVDERLQAEPGEDVRQVAQHQFALIVAAAVVGAKVYVVQDQRGDAAGYQRERLEVPC